MAIQHDIETTKLDVGGTQLLNWNMPWNSIYQVKKVLEFEDVELSYSESSIKARLSGERERRRPRLLER